MVRRLDVLLSRGAAPIGSRIVLLLALAGCATQHGAVTQTSFPPVAGRLVELSHPFDRDTVYWPTERSGFELKSEHHGPTSGGYFYAANAFSAPEHGGTHLDAPIHFAEGKQTTEQIPLDHLIAPCVVVDISARASKAPDTLLTVDDLEDFERKHGAITAGVIVLVRSDWSTRWPDRLAYLGSDRAGDASDLHFPGISAEAARALVQRAVAAVGIDTASIDHGPSREFWAHRILMEANVPAFENLTALARLPPRGAMLVALPMPIRGGSGGPLHAVGILP